ncbi:M56 family metallopeptidase [Brevibacillus sp. SYSU BS000544]|uniref:M56 family metallopeptidase n=1 Tax=Brevibacillus sp. SYSU BS000544 TaxID=3416443 RepID=UPI003CE4C0A5
MWENRSKVLFGSGVLIAGLIIIQMIMYALYVLVGIDPHFNLIQICDSWVKKYDLHSLSYVLNVLVFYTLSLMVWGIYKQIRLSRQAYRKMVGIKDSSVTEQMNQAYSHSKQDILVIRHADPLAFTMGFMKTRIVLSTGLLELLDEDESKAVIYHEKYHLKHSDPLKTLLLYLFSSVMWYLPILKSFHQNYRIIRELLADKYSIEQMQTPTHLGSALIKMIKRGKSTPLPFSHVSFAETSINYRIKQLVEPESDLPLHFPLKSLMISIKILLVLFTSFILALS